MTTTIILTCGGCDVQATGTKPLRGRFISLSGQDHGLGGLDMRGLLGSLFDAVPDGWMPGNFALGYGFTLRYL